jgi:putative flippase GtrA
MSPAGPPHGTAGRGLDARLPRFAAVGLATTLLDLGLFSALTGAGGLPAAAANPLSYSCGVAASFALNHRWTFADGRAGRRAGPAFLRFAAANAGGLALSTALVAALAVALPAVAAKAASVPVVFAWNFALARLWVFR